MAFYENSPRNERDVRNRAAPYAFGVIHVKLDQRAVVPVESAGAGLQIAIKNTAGVINEGV